MNALSKKILIALLFLLIFSAVGCGTKQITPATSDMQPVELRLAHMFPAVHAVETDLVQPWIKAIEEATNGLISVTSYPGQTLLNGPETYEGVEVGIADMGLSVFGYTPGRFPLLEAFELPGVRYNSSKAASFVLWEAIKQSELEELKDTKLLFTFATGRGDLITKKPVRTLEDLKGMEIRAFGKTVATLEALGAVPVAMPQSEVYEAAAKGIVQGNLAPIEVLEGWRQAEVFNYITYTPILYNSTFFFNMNWDTWNSFPLEIQTIIEEVSEDIFTKYAAPCWDKLNESALKFAVEKHGMEVIELSEEELERWRQQLLHIQEEFVEKVSTNGLPGREFLDLIYKLADKYNAIY